MAIPGEPDLSARPVCPAYLSVTSFESTCPDIRSVRLDHDTPSARTLATATSTIVT